MASTTTTQEVGGVDDVTSMNGQKQVNDVMKKVLFDEIDRDGSYFSYLFMEKIFGDNRTCQHCGAYGSGCVPSGNHSPEIFVIEEGIVGKQIVECVRCKKQETVLSHEQIEIPTDQRLRIRGLEVRYYCKKITHFEVLHDLLELLHVAAIEDVKRKKDRHADVASFMMNKAKRVCEEWCKTEYTELRYKKYLRLRRETLLGPDTKSTYPPEASDEYKEMYEMMANSFRSNRDKVIKLLELMKESLFDNPTRPSFMMWVSIAMMHSEQYQEFKMQYDPHNFKSTESSSYTSLKERFLSLSIPVGIKKIPVVFVLFELPRFYHYIDFLTRRMGKRKPLNFLTDSDKEELKKIDVAMTGVGSLHSPRPPQGHAPPDVQMCHQLERIRREDIPRMVTSEQFRGHLLENLTCRKLWRGLPVPFSPEWGRKVKVIVKIETDESEDSELTPFQLKEALKRFAGMPSQSTESVRLTVTPPTKKGGASAFLVTDKDDTNEKSITQSQYSSFGNAPISIPVPSNYSEHGAPVYASVETIENVPTEKLLAATTTHGFDLEALKKEMRLPDTKIVQNIREAELRYMPSKSLERIIKSCSDDVTFVFPLEVPGKTTNKSPAQLEKSEAVPNGGQTGDDELPYGMDRSLFEDHREVYTEIPLTGPSGEFSLYPLMYSTDIHNVSVPIYPFVIRSSERNVTKKALETVGRLFGIDIGGDSTPTIAMQKEVFERYLKIGLVVATRPDLFDEVEYYGAIKRAMHKGSCILIHVSLPEILREAGYEMSQNQTISHMRSMREKNQKSIMEAIREAKKITHPEAPDSYLLVIPGTNILTPQPPTQTDVDNSSKKKKKRKRRGKKKTENGTTNGEEEREEEEREEEERKMIELRARMRRHYEKGLRAYEKRKAFEGLDKNDPFIEEKQEILKMEFKIDKKEFHSSSSSSSDKKERSDEERLIKDKIEKLQKFKEKKQGINKIIDKEDKSEMTSENKRLLLERKEEDTKEKTIELNHKQQEDQQEDRQEDQPEVQQEDQQEEQQNKEKNKQQLEVETYNDETIKNRKTVRDKFRKCYNCYIAITGSIRLCSGCKKVCYCNRECQKSHWKEHKKTCSYILRKELTG